MTNTFRAELQLLVKAYDERGGKWPDLREQVLFQAVEDARAVLTRYGTPAIQPGPVASEVRASVVELQVGVEFLDNEGLVVIANYLRRAIALLERLSTSTNQEESK
jgi:hypothetical protein